MKIPWHSKTPEEAARLAGSDLSAGLSQKEAALREKERKNILFPRPKKTAFDFCRPVLFSFMPLLLLISGVAAFLTENRTAGYVLLLALLFHMLFLLAAYFKARAVIDAVEGSAEPAVKVLRGGRFLVISAEHLVQGDVIFLSRGDMIPADCRLISADRLVVRESGITRRRLIEKDPAAVGEKDPLEAANMLWAGCAVEEGFCRALVVETGEATYLARTKEKIRDEDFEKTPLVCGLKKLSALISGVLLGFLFLSAVVGFLPFTPLGFADGWLLGIAFAASAMSEFYAVFAYIALGSALFGAFYVRREERKKRTGRRVGGMNGGTLIKRLGGLDRIASVDRLLLPPSLFSPDSAYTLTAVVDPTGRRESPGPLLSRASRQVLRNGAFALGLSESSRDAGLSRGSAWERAGRFGRNAKSGGFSGEKDRETLLAEALARGIFGEPSRKNRRRPGPRGADEAKEEKEERYRLLGQGRTEEGTFYGLVASGEGIFLTLLAPRDRLLPRCGYCMRAGGIEPLNRTAAAAVLRSDSGNPTELMAVAIGVPDRNFLETRSPLTDGELFDRLSGKLLFEGVLVFERLLQEGLSASLASAREAGIGVTLLCEEREELAGALAHGFFAAGGDFVFPLSSAQELLAPQSALLAATPKEKREVLRVLQEKGERVAFLGEDLSDLPLLKAADVAVTLGTVVAGDTKIDMEGESAAVGERACDALRGSADLIVSPALPKGRGGFVSLLGALFRARAFFYNMNAVMRYLLTVTAAKAILTLASLFSGISFVTPVILALTGLGYDFAAVMAMALRAPSSRHYAYRHDDRALSRLLFPALLSGGLSAVAILLPALLAHSLFSSSAELFVTAALFPFSLLTLLSCHGSLFRPASGRWPVTGFALTLAAVLPTAILLFSADAGAFSPKMLLVLLLSLLLLTALSLLPRFFLPKNAIGGGKAKEKASDALKRTPCGFSKDTSKDTSKDASKVASKEPSKDTLKDTSKSTAIDPSDGTPNGADASKPESGPSEPDLRPGAFSR